MAKSLRNVVNPDDVVRASTAPTRCALYEMFMGPLDASRPGTRATSPASPVPPAAVAQRGRRGDRRRAGRRTSRPTTRPVGSCTHDRRGGRRHGRAEVQHRDRPAVRAEQPPHHGGRRTRDRRARGARPARADARAAEPAHRRGDLVASRQRGVARLRVVPRGRSGVLRRRRGRGGGAGERQGAGPGDGRGRCRRRRARDRGPGRRQGGRRAGRQDGPQGHRGSGRIVNFVVG